eukprot:SAG22_NODE_539_length_9317_cov_4.771209_8_plen_151_part_00
MRVELLAREDQPLLVARDALLVHDLGLGRLDGVEVASASRVVVLAVRVRTKISCRRGGEPRILRDSLNIYAVRAGQVDTVGSADRRRGAAVWRHIRLRAGLSRPSVFQRPPLCQDLSTQTFLNEADFGGGVVPPGRSSKKRKAAAHGVAK